MSVSIVKSFVADKTAQQIEKEGGTMNFASWQRLLPYFESACGKKDNEEIAGIIADDTGITFRLRIKKTTPPNPTPPI